MSVRSDRGIAELQWQRGPARQGTCSWSRSPDRPHDVRFRSSARGREIKGGRSAP